MMEYMLHAHADAVLLTAGLAKEFKVRGYPAILM